MPAEVALSHLSLGRIARTWWPLAASWLLMGAELPAVSAFVARLPDPEINLAAYGGVVLALALIIESPIIMLLAASTTLSRDMASYRKVWRFMMGAGAILTLLHVGVAFTPLYDLVVRGLLGAPDEIVEPARIGLMIMTPWTWAIAYRRFNQGVLIRFGHSRAVGAGTVVRLSATMAVLMAGLGIGKFAGVVVATCAVATGVFSEALFIGLCVRPVLRFRLAAEPPVKPRLTYGAFFAFYLPLVMTSLLSFLAQPIGSAALGRMPDALASLAAWPVVSGVVFIVRGSGMAFNEVAIALLDEPGAVRQLRRFTVILATATTAVLIVLAATPLSRMWFEQVSALSPGLAQLARKALWIALPMPALTTLQSWYQGILLHSRRTQGITQAVGLNLSVSTIILLGGVAWGAATGLYVGLAALVISSAVQSLWLARRARQVLPRERGVAPMPS